MPRRTFALVALAGLLAIPAGAAPAPEGGYQIKLKKEVRGDVTLVDDQEDETFAMKLTGADGNVLQEETKKSSHHFKYKEEVLEKEKGKRATKLRRTYTKAVSKTGDDSKTLPYQGKTVVIEKKDGKYTFTVQGGEELTGEDAAELNKEFNGKKKKDNSHADRFNDLILPKKPVDVGGTWTPDMKALTKDFAGDAGLEADASQSKGTGKLVKAYRKDGRQFGVLDMDFTFAITALGAGENMKIEFKKPARLNVQANMDVCIDGTVQTGTVKGKFKMTGTGSISVNGMEFTVKMDLSTTGKKTIQDLTDKKK